MDIAMSTYNRIDTREGTLREKPKSIGAQNILQSQDLRSSVQVRGTSSVQHQNLRAYSSPGGAIQHPERKSMGG